MTTTLLVTSAVASVLAYDRNLPPRSLRLRRFGNEGIREVREGIIVLGRALLDHDCGFCNPSVRQYPRKSQQVISYISQIFAV